MKLKAKAALLLLAIMMVFTTVACEKEGDAEKAGKKIGEAYKSVKDKVKDATK